MTFISTLLKAAAALFMLVILMLLVQLDLTAFQTVEVLAPGWGWLAFVSLLALEAGAVLWLGLAWFSRAPRLVLRDDPTEADRQAFARELERRLKKNPHVRAAGLRATDEHFLEKALDVLDARAGEEIRNSAKRVFLGTALSQNGRLDALIVFVSLARMVWRVSGIYNQRPTPAELWSVYSTVSSATFISFSIEALDIPRTITESMNELLPAVTPAMAASSVPLMGPMMQQCTSAVIDGAANCLLAIRAGVVTRSAFRFAALGREEARQQACVREAGTMLAEISRETVGAIVEAFRKQLVNLPVSMGQKISETVGTVADSALEKTRGAAQSVARGGTAVAEAVSSGAGAVIRDRHGGVAGPFLQGQHVRQRVPQAEIGVADDKARLVVLHPPYHLRLLLDGLGDIDEGDAALLRQGDAHLLSGYRLHDGGDHGHVHGESGLLPPPVLHHRGLEGDVCGNALRGGVAGHQQVLTEGTGGLGEKISHRATSFHQISSGSWIYRSSWKNSVDSTGLSL